MPRVGNQFYNPFSDGHLISAHDNYFKFSISEI